jgi:hypothetical protein
MKGLELLEKHPLAANVVRDWFMNQLLESFKDETVPEGFKQYMLEQGIDNDKVGTLIDVNPRNLLDVFDENGIIIYFMIFSSPEGVRFSANIHTGYDEVKPNVIGDQYKTRKEAELIAIDAAFEILENKLSPKEEKIN